MIWGERVLMENICMLIFKNLATKGNGSYFVYWTQYMFYRCKVRFRSRVSNIFIFVLEFWRIVCPCMCPVHKIIGPRERPHSFVTFIDTHHTQAMIIERFRSAVNLNMSIIVYFLTGLDPRISLHSSAASLNTSSGNGILLKFAILLTTFPAFSNRCLTKSHRNDSGRNLEIFKQKTVIILLNIISI